MAKRRLKHPEYYAIPAYMILAGKSYEECANYLGLNVRTYKEKITGYYDFSAVQGRLLSIFLGVSQDQIFLTRNVS